MRAYSCDFETTTDADDCRVWAYACCSIDVDFETVFGNSIEGFISWCEKNAPSQLYFHNLAFDGSFIMDYLLKNGWEWQDSQKLMPAKTFTTLISDMNALYSITLSFGKSKRVTIYDSLKIIPLSVANIAKSYGLPIGKGELDYTAYREVGHELTDEEKDYIRNDVEIVARVMYLFLTTGLTKMTAGSNALADYKAMKGGDRHFRRVFPEISESEDAFIRKAYRGGFTYVNPKYAGKEIGNGIVLDVNSLYPSVMNACDGQILPCCAPEWFDGEPQESELRPLWVALVTCRFKIKPDHIPCIQLKGNFRFKQTEYLTDSMGEVSFVTTSVDWKLITQQYDLRHVKWGGGYRFAGETYFFKDYVEKWVGVKNQATIDGNSGRRAIAKLMLNSLYGKFATRTHMVSRMPVMHEGVLHYIDLPEEVRKGVYLPVGVFITAYARYKTITSAQSVYDRFVYADTDSLHLVGTDIPENLDVDPVRLGAWKHESTFDRAKFLRAKTYIEHEEGKPEDCLTVHVAGMPDRCHSQVTFENFDFGASYEGKLYQHRVDGGIVLVEGSMDIRR